MNLFKKLKINVTVTDLRREPIPAAKRYEKDPLQESQLLYNEHLLGYEEQDGWIRVEAIEQQRFASQEWRGYPGWVLKSHVVEVEEFNRENLLVVQIPWGVIRSADQELFVSLGTRLDGIGQTATDWQVRLANGQAGLISREQVAKIPSEQPLLTPETRTQILSLGSQLIGYPYLWGGLSAYRPDLFSSCDCSGFVGLLYRVHGIDLPRDAHDQFLRSTPCEAKNMSPADLIFLANADNPLRMGHVMLYAGGDEFLDANITDGKVVQATARSRFGKPFSEMSNGSQIGKYIIHFRKT